MEESLSVFVTMITLVTLDEVTTIDDFGSVEEDAVAAAASRRLVQGKPIFDLGG